MINILLPYANAEKYHHVWAHEEKEIDFRRDFEKAERCTVSFAAEELCTYLNRMGLEAKVSDTACGQFIKLSCKKGSGEGFEFSEDNKNLTIHGEGRIGVLYGVYELLEAQGITWYSPWEEYVPENASELKIPQCKKYSPTMTLGRGFDFEGPLKESELLYLWMARNKLNLSACRPNTKHLQRKLGMTFKAGGHIFEGILNPNQFMPTGNRMIDDHINWYGKGNEPTTAENALFTQFCMSNHELLSYLWEKLLRLLNTDWYDADRVDVWGFDTWGCNCKCENCTKLGNGTDQTLHFISFLRDRLNEAYKSGKIDHNVRLVMCSYEGTATLLPPENGVPQNLRNSGDYVVYYPIIRCYEHHMDDKSCSYNDFYCKTLSGWEGIPMMVGEYYNVSKFEDLPLVFTDKISHDLKWYGENGISGMTYMHLPIVEWGMRAINQLLYAKLCWNKDTDTNAVTEKYFEDLYGLYSKKAKEVYSFTEEAVKHSTSWRAWCQRSVLSALLNWDGRKPSEKLFRDDHLSDNAVSYGKISIELLKHSLSIMKEIHTSADLIFAKNCSINPGVPVNPTDTRFKQKKNELSDRVSQDIRGLKYAIDVYELMVGFVEYHEALMKGESTDALWKSISELCVKMKEYCYSIKYKHPAPELSCVDALERSGLKDLYYRCLAYRIN